MSKKIWAIMAFLFISGTAFAQEGIYGSVGFGNSEVTSNNIIIGDLVAVPLGGTTLGRFKGDDTSFKLQGGYRLNKNLAVEVTWQDNGDPDPFSTGILDDMGNDIVAVTESTALQVAALGFLPLGDGVFEIFGRAGVSFVDEKLRYSGFPPVVATLQVYNTNRNESNALFAYGLGMQLNLATNKKFIVRAEWEQTRGQVMDRYDYFGVTVGINFGDGW
jgi:hypothetical protein